MHPVLEVADAVKARLDARAWTGETPSIKRTYLPRVIVRGQKPLAEIEKLKIDAVPVGFAEEQLTRGGIDQLTCTIDVGFSKYVGREAGEQGDALINLVGLVSDEFTNWEATLPSGLVAQLVSKETLTLTIPEQLEEHGVMTSVLRLTVNVFR